MQGIRDYGFLFFLHLGIVVVALLAPFFVGWDLILIFIAVYYLQLIFFRQCVLTRAQFKTLNRDNSFYHYYLAKLGFDFDKRRLRIFLDYALPWIILAAALVWQIMLQNEPALSLVRALR